MNNTIPRCLILLVCLAALPLATGCRLNGGPFYSPSAWQFYNPFKSQLDAGLDENAFDDIEADAPSSRPPVAIAKMDSPSISPPLGGYGANAPTHAVAGTTPKQNEFMNVDLQEKKSIGTQNGLYARSNSSEGAASTTISMTSNNPPVTQTPNAIARNTVPEQQPWGQSPPSSYNPNYNPNAYVAAGNQGGYQQPLASQGYSPTQPPMVAQTQPSYGTPAMQTSYAPSSSNGNMAISAQQSQIYSPAPVTTQMSTPGSYAPSGNYTQPGVAVPVSNGYNSYTAVPPTTTPQTATIPQTTQNYSATGLDNNGFAASPATNPVSTPSTYPAQPYNAGFNSFAPTANDYRPGTATF